MKNKKNSFLSKILLLGGAVIVLLLIFFAGQKIYQKREIQKVIDNLQRQAEKLNKDNVSIAEKISYLESQNYQEKEAKDKLNLQSPDEKVIIVQPGTVKKEITENANQESVVQPVSPPGSNFKKWWAYFFK